MKSINCSKISNIPYNLIFTAKFNDSSIIITIISCDYLNLSLANEYIGDVTIPTQVIEYNQYLVSRVTGGLHGRDRMVVGFTTTCVPITTKVVSSNPVHGEVYSIQH
jgi:hypothetical protein